MDNSKHTPGPWTVDTGEPSFVVAKGYAVSIPGNADDIGTPAAVANARLIASAPELLALLNRGLETGVFNEIPVFKHHVVTLVEKITGGSNE